MQKQSLCEKKLAKRKKINKCLPSFPTCLIMRQEILYVQADSLRTITTVLHALRDLMVRTRVLQAVRGALQNQRGGNGAWGREGHIQNYYRGITLLHGTIIPIMVLRLSIK